MGALSSPLTVRAQPAGTSVKVGILSTVNPRTTTFFKALAHRLHDALKNRISIAGGAVQFVDAGALMAYGANLDEMFSQAAPYIDKILKGTKPSDLPVEQPTKLELAINLKTAKALGLTVQQSIVVRADKVVQ